MQEAGALILPPHGCLFFFLSVLDQWNSDILLKQKFGCLTSTSLPTNTHTKLTLAIKTPFALEVPPNTLTFRGVPERVFLVLCVRALMI